MCTTGNPIDRVLSQWEARKLGLTGLAPFVSQSDRYLFLHISWSAWLDGWIMRRNFNEFYAFTNHVQIGILWKYISVYTMSTMWLFRLRRYLHATFSTNSILVSYIILGNKYTKFERGHKFNFTFNFTLDLSFSRVYILMYGCALPATQLIECYPSEKLASSV